MDDSCFAAGWSGGGFGVVFPQQKAALWQSIECHSVCASNLFGGTGGLIAFQPLDSAEIQLGGDAYDYPCARQFFFHSTLQGLRFL